VQLFHPGREIMEGRDGTIPVAWSPSATPTERFHIQPHELTQKMIRELISGYAAAPRRLKQAGSTAARWSQATVICRRSS
jgi:2,4-dienoyl-CoA reductase-like NADH-dependent reductase (Old Yellow Enzyme family)